ASSDGVTWTATFTPDADIDEPSNFITLNNGDVEDENGNAGVGTSSSASFSIRTLSITFLVTSKLDTGDDFSTAATLADDLADGNGLSLREAVYWARSGDTITFDLESAAGAQGGTIILGGNELYISHSA